MKFAICMFVCLSLYLRGNEQQCFYYQHHRHCHHCCSEQDITNSSHDLSTQHDPFRPWGLHQPVHCGPTHLSNSTFLHRHCCQCNFSPVYPDNLGHLLPCIWLCGMLLLGRVQTEVQDIATHTQRRHLFNLRASKSNVLSVLKAIPVIPATNFVSNLLYCITHPSLMCIMSITSKYSSLFNLNTRVHVYIGVCMCEQRCTHKLSQTS